MSVGIYFILFSAHLSLTLPACRLDSRCSCRYCCHYEFASIMCVLSISKNKNEVIAWTWHGVCQIVFTLIVLCMYFCESKNSILFLISAC